MSHLKPFCDPIQVKLQGSLSVQFDLTEANTTVEINVNRTGKAINVQLAVTPRLTCSTFHVTSLLCCNPEQFQLATVGST